MSSCDCKPSLLQAAIDVMNSGGSAVVVGRDEQRVRDTVETLQSLRVMQRVSPRSCRIALRWPTCSCGWLTNTLTRR